MREKRTQSIDHFPAQLAARRSQAGWTLRELGDRVGVSLDLIGAFERAVREPSLRQALAIAQTLGCRIERLLEPPEHPIIKRGPGRPRKNS